jgi:hypothetical protein
MTRSEGERSQTPAPAPAVVTREEQVERLRDEVRVVVADHAVTDAERAHLAALARELDIDAVELDQMIRGERKVAPRPERVPGSQREIIAAQLQRREDRILTMVGLAPLVALVLWFLISLVGR